MRLAGHLEEERVAEAFEKLACSIVSADCDAAYGERDVTPTAGREEDVPDLAQWPKLELDTCGVPPRGALSDWATQRPRPCAVATEQWSVGEGPRERPWISRSN